MAQTWSLWRSKSEDPADASVEADVEGGEFGHARESMGESAVVGIKDDCLRFDDDRKFAHKKSKVGASGESEDDIEVVGGMGDGKNAVEQTLSNGGESGTCAGENDEVVGFEVLADGVQELDGEGEERHGYDKR